MELIELLKLAAPVMAKGVGYTLIFAITSMIGGLFFGCILAILRIVPYTWIRWPATFYVSLMRGTPLLVQVFVIYYGLPSIGIKLSPITSGILALGLNASAYISESLRGAILGVNKAQWSASYSLGLTYTQTLVYIIIPQALRTAVPALSNTLVSLIKDTSLVSVITVTELMLATKDVIATTFKPLPLYITAAVIYWALSLAFEVLQHRVERRLRFAYR